jgi:hypothetical protein
MRKRPRVELRGTPSGLTHVLLQHDALGDKPARPPTDIIVAQIDGRDRALLEDEIRGSAPVLYVQRRNGWTPTRAPMP